MKTCNRCELALPPDCFGTDRQRPDGKMGRCRDCVRIARGRDNDECDEPTEEEVERTVAEQLLCLPGWWWKASEVMRGMER